ncbi:hypothetical protein GCM10020000_12330 [Streptomyces olivoverticillatus]
MLPVQCRHPPVRHQIDRFTRYDGRAQMALEAHQQACIQSRRPHVLSPRDRSCRELPMGVERADGEKGDKGKIARRNVTLLRRRIQVLDHQARAERCEWAAGHWYR